MWEVSKFLVDEGQQYTEDMVVYLMSRMRNPACKYKPHMKITCNPLKESYLRKWLDWYIDENGFPIQERSGVLRYFVRQNNEMKWANSYDECIELYGKSHLPKDHKDQVKPLSFTFIPATVYDNPILMEKQPEYVGWLEGLGRVEKDRLLYGNWDVTQESLGYFKKEWLTKVNPLELDIIEYCRAWDIAGSIPSEAMPNPDYTAGVLIGKTRQGRYVILDVVRFRARYGEVMRRIIETGLGDPPMTKIVLPQEPGQAGKVAGQSMVRDLIESGLYAKLRNTNKSKVVRFQPFIAAAEAGLVDYIEAEWNDDYFSELTQFTNTRNQKDDQVDATSDAFITLATKFQIPSISIPSFTKKNEFNV